MELITKNAEETKKLGKELAANLAIKDGARIIALTGDLGSGKTTFVQGFAEGLGIEHRIISPTFIILRKYLIEKSEYKFKNLYHLDLYRLEGKIHEEVKNLGIDEIWKSTENIVIIEWAEKIKNIIPKEAVWMKFENMGNNLRKITTI